MKRVFLKALRDQRAALAALIQQDVAALGSIEN